MTEGLQGARMSANSFDVLQLTPAAGRMLRDSDDLPQSPKVALLSYRLWQRQFHGAPTVVGQSIRLNAESYTVVGVLPAHFPLPLRDIDVVVPLIPDRDPRRFIRESVNFLRLFGRLNPGVTGAQADAELTTICRSLKQQFPAAYTRKNATRTTPLREALIGDFRQSMLLLLGAVIVVLATALANLLSIVLVRVNERRAELSIRAAIGASRWRLLRQFLVESILLVLSGAALGLVLGNWAVKIAVPWIPSSIPRLEEVSFDVRVLILGAAIAAVAALVMVSPLGLMLRFKSGLKSGDALRGTGRGNVGDRWSVRVRQAMVVAEISAALILLLTTSVLLQNLRGLQNVHLGFQPDSVFQVRISLPPTYKKPDDLARFYDRLAERIANAPSVLDVGVVSVAPLSGLLLTSPFKVAGEAQHERDMPNVNVRAITPRYLSAVGTRLLEGRSFSESDRSDTLPVALVSAALAEQFLRTSGNHSALGRRLTINDNNHGARPLDVIGVVENVRQAALDGPPALDIYIPLRQIHPDNVDFLQKNQFWMIRTSLAPGLLRSTFLEQLRAVDPDAAVASTGTMRDYVEESLGPRRFNLGLFAVFSLTGVLLAVFGVYGLVSYTVSQRRREIGLRMAIGASVHDIQRLVLGQAIRLGLGGSILGCCLAAAARPLATHVAQDVSISTKAVLATTSLLVMIVVLAAWIPARRAARISPVEALRCD